MDESIGTHMYLEYLKYMLSYFLMDPEIICTSQHSNSINALLLWAVMILKSSGILSKLLFWGGEQQCSITLLKRQQ